MPITSHSHGCLKRIRTFIGWIQSPPCSQLHHRAIENGPPRKISTFTRFRAQVSKTCVSCSSTSSGLLRNPTRKGVSLHKMVGEHRIELWSQASDARSLPLADSPMVEESGFEPLFSCFQNKRERPDFPIPRLNWSELRELNPLLIVGNDSDCQYPKLA